MGVEIMIVFLSFGDGYKKWERKPQVLCSPFIKVRSSIQRKSQQRPCVNSVSRIRKNTVSAPLEFFPIE